MFLMLVLFLFLLGFVFVLFYFVFCFVLFVLHRIVLEKQPTAVLSMLGNYIIPIFLFDIYSFDDFIILQCGKI